ncbi:hypothetical protein [Actinoplanes xinjiangensis]|uniref:hypothetical protein n=1 Tax=Actinoplanes xinjiangensis TaxID=512350 RepID=UPI00343D7AEC
MRRRVVRGSAMAAVLAAGMLAAAGPAEAARVQYCSTWKISNGGGATCHGSTIDGGKQVYWRVKLDCPYGFDVYSDWQKMYSYDTSARAECSNTVRGVTVQSKT